MITIGSSFVLGRQNWPVSQKFLRLAFGPY